MARREVDGKRVRTSAMEMVGVERSLTSTMFAVRWATGPACYTSFS
jgi:hypothetical protein